MEAEPLKVVESREIHSDLFSTFQGNEASLLTDEILRNLLIREWYKKNILIENFNFPLSKILVTPI